MSMTPNGNSLGQRWLSFWFAPLEPTTLGFIRIVTGLLVLYTHLAYCYDLTNFFGKEAWYNLESIDRERKEMPSLLTSFWSWDDLPPGAHIPEYPHRKEAVMRWLRDVTDDENRMSRGLRYIDKVQATQNEMYGTEGITYIKSLSNVDTIRKAQLQALVNESLRKPPVDKVPQWLAALPETGPNSRTEIAADVEAFVDILPVDQTDRSFVLTHFLEIGILHRGRFLEFMREVASLDPEERKERLDYMEYWNQEKKYAYSLGSPIFSLWFHITEPNSMRVAHGVVIGIIFLFTIGFCTRVTSILTWLVVVSYIHRTQQVLFGMDTMMNILLIYLMVGNCGAALSVDRLIARYRASRNSLRKHGRIDEVTEAFLAKPLPSRSTGFATRLLQIHFAMIYLAAGLSKLKGNAWWTTDAYWDTVVNPEFTMIHFPWYDALVRGMTEFRPVYAIAAALGVMFTLATEIGLPFLVWTRLRPYVITMGVMFHAGVAIFMGLWIFSLLMMTMLLIYIPPSIVRDRLFGKSPDEEPTDEEKLAVTFDKSTDTGQRSAATIMALDFDRQVELHDGKSFSVKNGQGTHSNSEGVKILLRKLSWVSSFSWLLFIPGLSGWLARRIDPPPANGV